MCFEVQLFPRDVPATFFFNCYVMKPDANELCGVELPLAQVELTLHCGWKLHLPTLTWVLAVACWGPGNHLRQLISLKVKEPEGKVFISFSWSALKVQPGQREWGQERELLGGG